MTATLDQHGQAGTLDDGQPVPPYLADFLTTTQHRKADIEHVDPIAGTILMRAAPYDHEIQLAPDLWESFAPAAFAAASKAPHRSKLWNEHRGPVVGCGVDIEDRPDGIWIRARFANTLAGQEARELARDKIKDQVSVEFRPLEEWLTIKRAENGLHIRHKRAHLLGVALVAHGAYDDEAFVASVRDQSGKDREKAQALAAEKAERLARLDRLGA
jgi:HK97 family phage prohead protease